MKSQRRHELKENVLAHELGQMKTFFNRYGNWIWGASFAVLIVVMIFWHYHSRSATEAAEQRNRFELLMRDMYESDKKDSALAGLMELAENASDPALSASASMFVADFCADRYGEALRRSDTEKSTEYGKKAEKYYRMVIEKHPHRKNFVARAHFGFGELAENNGDWEKARKEYEQVCRVVGEAYPVAFEAKLRLKQLGKWSKPVRFSTTMPTTAPTTTSPTEATTTRPETAVQTSRPASKPVRTEMNK